MRFFCLQKVSFKYVRYLWSFLNENNSFKLRSLSLPFQCFQQSFQTSIRLVWRLSFGEIELLRDSTTMALFPKNNVFIVHFYINCASFVCKMFHSATFSIYGVFCTKITHSNCVRCLCHFNVFNNQFRRAFVLCGAFRLQKSSCLGTQLPWHFFLKITSSSFISISIALLLFAKSFIQVRSIFMEFITRK